MNAPPNETSRPLTEAELTLTRYMLEHGSPEARSFLPQLEQARASKWRCGCGCASFKFVVDGSPGSRVGFHPIDDFVFGEDDNLSGIFVWENGGYLGGVEIFTYTAEVSGELPSPESLRLVSWESLDGSKTKTGHWRP